MKAFWDWLLQAWPVFMGTYLVARALYGFDNLQRIATALERIQVLLEQRDSRERRDDEMRRLFP